MNKIRHAQQKDYSRILEIYAHAREFMKQTGNPRQWGDVWPPADVIQNDINEQKNYVYVDDQDVAHAVFYYRYGDHCDPTYDVIHDGSWKEETPYGVVHRIASDGEIRGAGKECIRWAMEKSGHLRIDTHGDNKVMQKVVTSLGFEYCGIIYVEEDNDPRFAYEYIR